MQFVSKLDIRPASTMRSADKISKKGKVVPMLF